MKVKVIVPDFSYKTVIDEETGEEVQEVVATLRRPKRKPRKNDNPLRGQVFSTRHNNYVFTDDYGNSLVHQDYI